MEAQQLIYATGGRCQCDRYAFKALSEKGASGESMSLSIAKFGVRQKTRIGKNIASIRTVHRWIHHCTSVSL